MYISFCTTRFFNVNVMKIDELNQLKQISMGLYKC